ncbi:MAG: hypothetical protein AAF826_04455 [Pseudomonadota bacterium]
MNRSFKASSEFWSTVLGQSCLSILDLGLTVFPWTVIILIAEPSVNSATQLVYFSCGAFVLAMRWWAKETDFSRRLRTGQAVVHKQVISSAIACGLLLLCGVLISPIYALTLSVVAGLAWSAPMLWQALLNRDARRAPNRAARELHQLGLWRGLCAQFGLSNFGTDLLPQRMRMREALLTDTAAVLVACLVVVVWPASPAYSALIVLALAALSIWGHVNRLSWAFLDLRRPEATHQQANLQVSQTKGEFGLLHLDGISHPPVKEFSAELFNGLCLMLVGPSGSGKSELLRGNITGGADGKVSYTSTSEAEVDQIFAYAPSDAYWLPNSIDGYLRSNNADLALAHRMLQELDPFDEAFGEVDAYGRERFEVTNVQSKMISLVRCFASTSPVLVFDAPENHLDQTARAAFVNLALEAKLSGKILLIATEDDRFMSLADELVKLEKGIITDRGPMAEVRERHRDRFLRAMFHPTVQDAFRLTLWLETLMPEDMPQDLAERVKYAAEELLLRAPRDHFIMGVPVYFDVKLGSQTCIVTLRDRGDPIGLDHIQNQRASADLLPRGVSAHTLLSVANLADHIGETQFEGYRHVTAVFHANAAEAGAAGYVTELDERHEVIA